MTPINSTINSNCVCGAQFQALYYFQLCWWSEFKYVICLDICLACAEQPQLHHECDSVYKIMIIVTTFI